MPRFACITCGPAHEPIDAVRRITNFSTGEIGTILSDALHSQGWDVLCLRGEGATFPAPVTADVQTFSTNDSLVEVLQGLDRAPDLILHAAALCDYTVAAIEGASGSAKLSSRDGDIHLTLRPATKILPCLRDWFPYARIIGWKYEVDGPREQALARAEAQLLTARTDACILNGSAYGPGFGLLSPNAPPIHFPDKPTLARHLATEGR